MKGVTDTKLSEHALELTSAVRKASEHKARAEYLCPSNDYKRI